jgi:hypothetical protein
LAGVEGSLDRFPERVFAFDEFGPLGIGPTVGAGWAAHGHPQRLPATYRRTHSVRCFHGWRRQAVGVSTRRRKGTASTLAALRSIRAVRPDGAPIYVLLDNLATHKGTQIRDWARKHRLELCFTPIYAFWANPIEATSARCGSSPSRAPTIATTPPRPGTARLPALAQRQRPPPRRCGRSTP